MSRCTTMSANTVFNLKPFHFQQFSIQQSPNVFRVGTDGVLLGALSTVCTANTILEVGTGTGLISLMLAQRNTQAEITAIDLSEDAVRLADINFTHSPFAARLTAQRRDFTQFQSNKKFDLIVCNPPYFEPNASTKDRMARQQIDLTFSSLCENAAQHLTFNGKFSVIIPATAAEIFEKTAHISDLYLQRTVRIFGRKSGPVKRCVLEFGFTKQPAKLSTLIIEAEPRVFTEEYLALTKDFHVLRPSTSAD